MAIFNSYVKLPEGIFFQDILLLNMIKLLYLIGLPNTTF